MSQTPAPAPRRGPEVRPQTFLVHQRQYRLHSVPTPVGLPNTFPCFASLVWTLLPVAAEYRPLSLLLAARSLSGKQRPSCAIEDTLPNGISWGASTVNHCLRTEPGTTLMIGVLKTHH